MDIFTVVFLLGCAHARCFSSSLWKEERQHRNLRPSSWGTFPWWSLGEASWEQSTVDAVSETTLQRLALYSSVSLVWGAVSVSPGWSPRGVLVICDTGESSVSAEVLCVVTVSLPFPWLLWSTANSQLEEWKWNTGVLCCCFWHRWWHQAYTGMSTAVLLEW